MSAQNNLEIVNIFWFRRDLRLHNNNALYQALKEGIPVVPLFIFDRDILDELEDRNDRRVEFIHQSLLDMQKQLAVTGSTLDVRFGIPAQVWNEITEIYSVHAVYANHDYEPYARHRDRQITELLQKRGIPFFTFKDHVIFEKNEIVKDNGEPYTVFTPYSRKWKSNFGKKNLNSFPSEKNQNFFFRQGVKEIPSLNELGFKPAGFTFPGKHLDKELIIQYKQDRDFPAVNGTSRLSVHLRFGTISIRELAREAGMLNETFLNELIWREFFQMILWHFPQVVDHSFKPKYDKINWRNDEDEFQAWCEGRTGYPIVDAGMKELNATGYMHNRVRMITASFLTKHLLIDWRWGETYFAKKLLDFDLASNNGGWQWAAGCGCDAAPYFRIFNPYLQTKKFDPELKYIRKWVPEFEELVYPKPIIEHEKARKRCLEVYQTALK